MRGERSILRMRMAGHRPALVWLLALDTPCPRSYFLDAERSLEFSRRPEVHVGSDENPATLDFRPLVDLTVLLQGSCRQRLRAIFSRLTQFDPQRVIVSSADFIYEYTQKED